MELGPHEAAAETNAVEAEVGTVSTRTNPVSAQFRESGPALKASEMQRLPETSGTLHGVSSYHEVAGKTSLIPEPDVGNVSGMGLIETPPPRRLSAEGLDARSRHFCHEVAAAGLGVSSGCEDGVACRGIPVVKGSHASDTVMKDVCGEHQRKPGYVFTRRAILSC